MDYIWEQSKAGRHSIAMVGFMVMLKEEEWENCGDTGRYTATCRGVTSDILRSAARDIDAAKDDILRQVVTLADTLVWNLQALSDNLALVLGE